MICILLVGIPFFYARRMWLPKKSTSGMGFAKGLLISIGSFVAIHAAFIVVHEIVDESTPQNTITYPIDRFFESAEIFSARMRGKVHLVEKYAYLAEERIEELEHSLEQNYKPDAPFISELLEDTYSAISASLLALEEIIASENNDVHSFTLALLVESAADDITQRLRNAEGHLSEEHALFADETLNAIGQLVEKAVDITQKFDVEKSIAESMRQDIQKQIILRRTIPDSPSSESTCSEKHETCSTARDCCEHSGLTCSPVFLSDGSRSRRCVAL